MAFIAFSTCMVVGLVIFLWLSYNVLVRHLLLVTFMWHTCVL